VSFTVLTSALRENVMIEVQMNEVGEAENSTETEPGMDRRALLGGGLTFGALAVMTDAADAQTVPAAASAGPGRLTCHVLDTYSGRPGEGMKVELSMRDGAGWKLIKSAMTVPSGRTADPLMTGDGMLTGEFMLEFFHSDYFGKRAFLPNPPFYDKVVHFFSIAAKDTKYHITMVAAPWGYSTFRWKE
jgi:5-hydroxyisourate hydrolase